MDAAEFRLVGTPGYGVVTEIRWRSHSCWPSRSRIKISQFPPAPLPGLYSGILRLSCLPLGFVWYFFVPLSLKTLLTRGFSASPGSDDLDDLARCSKPAGHDLAVWLLAGKMTQSLSLFQILRRKSDQLGLGHVLSLELEMRRLVEHNNHMTPWHDIPSCVGKPGRFSKAEGGQSDWHLWGKCGAEG